jgi:hypothetical protein
MPAMSTRLAPRDLPGMRPWIPVLAPVVTGVVAATYGVAQGTGWRQFLATSPHATGPAVGLLIVAVIGGLSLVGGLVLVTSTHSRRSIGSSLFAFGVGLSCGVVIGFFW